MKFITSRIPTWLAPMIAAVLISHAHAAAPVANAGPDLVIADYDGDGSVTVRLNASASTDVDNDIFSYDWTWDDGSAIGPIAEITLPASNSPVTVTLTVTDHEANVSTDTLVITAYQKETALFKDFNLKVAWSGANATLAGETLVMTSAPGIDAVYRREAGIWSEMPIPYTFGGNHVAVDQDTIFGGFFYDGTFLKSLRHDGFDWNAASLNYPDPIIPWQGVPIQFAVDPDTVVVSDYTASSFAGRVLAYNWSEDNLTLNTELLPSAGFTPGPAFGKKIAVKGDLMVTASNVTYGDQLHIFRKTAGNWNFEATLTADPINWWFDPNEANYFKTDNISIANGKILVARYDPFQMVVIEMINGNWVQTPISSNAFGTPFPGALSYGHNLSYDKFSYEMNDDGQSFVVGDDNGRFFLFTKGQETPNWAGSSASSRRLLTRDLTPTTDTRVTSFSNGLIVLSDSAGYKARVIDTATSVHPVNVEPIADGGPDITDTSFDGNPVSVFLDGSGSRDLNYNSPITLVWTWDGGSATGLQPTVSLPPSVTFVVLTVTDVGGAIARDTIQINIESPPVIDAGPDLSVVDTDGDGLVQVRVNGTVISQDNPIDSWVWTWPGGSLNGQSGTITLGASANGKPVTLKVIDSDGLVREDQFLFRIATTNPKPVLVQGPGGRPLDNFGEHVAIQNGTSLASAPGVRVDGDTVGATYLSRKINNAWPQSSLAPGVQQGSGVLIDGDTAFVGASSRDLMDVTSQTVLAAKAGGVMVYERLAGAWTQTDLLTPPVPPAHPNPNSPPEGLLADAQFGHSMAKSGNWLVIGAVRNLVEAPIGNYISWAGSVYLFENTGGTWTFRQKLNAPDATQSGGFGSYVAIHGDSLVVSAYTGAYVFSKGATQWDFTIKFQPDDTPGFGGNVVMDDSEVLIGASGEFNGILPGNSRGVIYRFTKSGNTWAPAGKIIPTVMRGISNGNFGFNLCLKDNILAVGAPLDAEGRVDVWRKVNDAWEFVDDIFITSADDPNLNISARFGWSVSHDGKDLIVGAPSGFNSSGQLTGKAYIFEDYAALIPDANHEPLSHAGADIQVADTIVRDPLTNEISEPLGSELVTLDGTASSDLENAVVSYQWTWAGGTASGANPSARFPVGTTVVTLTVTDAANLVSSDTVNVTVSLPQPAPAALPPSSGNSLALDLFSPLSKWRLSSEFLWHGDNEAAVGVVDGATYQVEILPYPGSTEVVTAMVTVAGSNTTQIMDLELPEPPTANGTLSFPETSQGFSWRLSGESTWRNVTDDGDAFAEDVEFSVPEGLLRIEFKPVAGFTTPQTRVVNVIGNALTPLDWAEYLRINSFDPAKTFELVPSPDLTASPYRYTGMIRSALGRGTGTVVAERTVLTAAHLFFDANGLQWADVEWFSRQQQGTRQAPPLTPRGVLYQTSYAKLIAPDSVEGTVADLPEDPQEVDFAVLYFSDETTWDQGSANFLQSTSSKNWLSGTENKHAVGYPQRSQAFENRGRMFEKQFATPLQSLGTGLYETTEVFGDGGASGSALFVQPAGSSNFYPAAILLAGQGRAVYRLIDEDITRMIKDGEDAATGNDDVLNNDSSLLTFDFTGSFTTIGVQVFPAGIRTQARWTITPVKGAISANMVTTKKIAFNEKWSSYTISFAAISGYRTPAPLRVLNGQVIRNSDNIHPFTYTAISRSSSSPIDIWKQANNVTDLLEDSDDDGMKDLLEYALDRNPAVPDVTTPIRIKSQPSQNTHVEYEVYVSNAAEGIFYHVKASNNLDRSNAITLDTFTSADGISDYLTVTDTQPKASSLKRFAWVEIEVPSDP